MNPSYSKKAAYQQVVELLLELQSATPDPEKFKTFMGFGALKELLLPLDNLPAWSAHDLRYEPGVRKVFSLLAELFTENPRQVTEALKASLLTSYYTPDFVITPIVQAISKHRPDVRTILEPSAGTGRFVAALRNYFPKASITAIEIDHLAARILKASHPETEVIRAPFEEAKLDTADLIISNIPFGNYNVYDDKIFRERNPVKIKSTSRIHNYYFVKGLDSLSEGGLLAFITTSGVMDSPGNKEIREYLVKHADLVTAIRLPDSTFASAGTFPTTDIILLRKCPSKKQLSADEKAFIELHPIQAEDDAGEIHHLNVNHFYTRNPEHALGQFKAGGQYEKNALTLAPLETDTPETVSKAIHSIITQGLEQLTTHMPVETVTPKTKPAASTAPELPDHYPHLDILKPGNLATYQHKAGLVTSNPNGRKTLNIDRSLINTEQVQAFSELRNTTNRLLTAEMEHDQAGAAALRVTLNDQYDLFSFRFGPLNNTSNKKVCSLDVDGFKLLALERVVEQQYVKSDIFSKQITNTQKELTKPESVQDAVLLSLNEHNGVNIEYMAALMQRATKQVVAEAIEADLIYRDLSDASAGYMTRDQFLSGKVVERLAQWESIHNESQPNISDITTPEIDKNIELLKTIQPIYLKIDLIDVSIGERWVPIDIYESFAQSIFASPVSIKYLPSNDNYYVQVLESSNENRITYAATTAEGPVYGSRIMEYAMADYQPVFTKPSSLDPKKRTVDADGMKNVEMKIREVKEAFQEFIKSRPDIAETIEQIYNRKFNSKVNRHFDGSHLKLPGLQHFTPYKSQKDAVWMMLQNAGGIVDQKVGAGKTLIMILAAMEMKRIDLSRKTLILCLKANVAAVVSDFQKAYPQARLLAPDPEKDFTPGKRKAIFANIAMNDWDAVLLTHEQFMAIPQCPEITLNVLHEELANVEADLAAASESASLSKRVLKGLIVRKKSLEARFKKTESEIKRDDVWHFGNMGFDQMFVDESHEYKNLQFTTRYSNVAGLGSPQGSKRSFNMELAVRTLQKKNRGDKGVTFLSGTTISNSLVELYLLFKYLRPSALADLSIHNFDAWAKVYARKSSSYEFTVTNEVKLKERFREFVKVPELAQFYSEITHYVGPHNFKQDKPSLKNIVVNIDPTETQRHYISKLIEFSRTKNPACVGLSFSSEQLNAHMLIATTLAKKMSLDMRLIDPLKYRFKAGSKIDTLCKTVYTEYMDSTEYKGVQLIFCDLGTPTTKGFNVYAEVKRILVENYRIPAEEVQFIHDFSGKNKKAGFLKDIRSGKIRIALGGTKNLGTGNNVQDRVIAMHHLDIPWTPKDLEQRGGRGERPGNFAAKNYRDNIVNNYIYAVNQTLDAYQFNILANKQKFIMQIKHNAVDVRKIEEGSFDQEGGMNFSEYVAILSGNTDLLEKVKLEKKLADLERGYTVFLKRKAEAEFNISLNERVIQNIRKDIEKYQTDWTSLEGSDLEKLPLIFEGKPVLDKKQLGEHLLTKVEELRVNARSNEVEPLLHLNHFTLMSRVTEIQYSSPKAYDVEVFVRSNKGNVYHYANGTLNANPALAGRYIIDCVKRIPKIVEDNETRISDLNAKIYTYQRVIASEFEDKHQIKLLKAQIEDLALKIEKQYNIPEPESRVEVMVETSAVNPSECLN